MTKLASLAQKTRMFLQLFSVLCVCSLLLRVISFMIFSHFLLESIDFKLSGEYMNETLIIIFCEV